MKFPARPVALSLLLVSVLAIALLTGCGYLSGINPQLSAGKTPAVDTAMADSDYYAAIENGRKRIADLRSESHYPSVSVALIHGNKLVWQEAIGFANLATGEAASSQTQYPIGSISKSLTATAAMMMAETQLLSLDTEIETYLPDLPKHYHGVTLRQLLSHQAGVRHYRLKFNPPFFSESGLNKDFESVEDGLSIFIDDPLLFAPDTSFNYSTFGYSLASRVMEAAAGMDFLQLMTTQVLEPFSLHATEPDLAESPTQQRSKDYLSVLWGLVAPTPDTNSSMKWAGGGFVSTPADLARFGQSLLAGAALDKSKFLEMTTPRTLSSGEINPQNYGLGWRSGRMIYPPGSDSTIPIIHHGGTALGAECILLLIPDQVVVVAICGNAYTGGSDELLQLAANLARDFIRDHSAGAD